MAYDLDFERGIYNRRPAAAPAGGLFDTFADRVLRRADEVLLGEQCKWPPSSTQTLLLKHLRNHQGKGRALALGHLAERMRLAPRQIKELVQELRLNFGVQVGASRDSDGGGYYLIATHEESVESSEQMLAQATTMLRVVAALRGGRAHIDEMLTQLRLDLMQEDAR